MQAFLDGAELKSLQAQIEAFHSQGAAIPDEKSLIQPRATAHKKVSQSKVRHLLLIVLNHSLIFVLLVPNFFSLL